MMKRLRIKSTVALLLALSLLLCSFGFAQAIVIPQDVKNVILMIGDGMGENSINWASAATGEKLFIDTIPYKGYSQTDSLSGTTDSAAGATALSCGYHAFNSNLGQCSFLINGHGANLCTYLNVCEAAQSIGKKTGVVTSDDNSGATPSGFSAHTYKREMPEEITKQQMECGLDILWAKDNGVSSKAEAEKHGWQYCETLAEILASDGSKKSFAAVQGDICFDNGSDADAPLSALTSAAIEKLDNGKGFFLMVEGAHIDKYSHANDSENMFKAMLEFDKSIKAAVDFAKRDGNTIVIVTADHETGGIVFDSETKSYKYTSGGHTNTDVPVRVFGSYDLVKNGETVVNTDIAKFIAKKIGYTDTFPKFTLNFAFPAELFSALFAALKDKIG